MFQMTEQLGTYDYVIVGASPSAIGLLYGLLEPLCRPETDSNTDDCICDKFTIAWIEIGGDTTSSSTKKSTTAKNCRKNDDDSTLMIQSNLSKWYQTSHVSNPKWNQLHNGRVVSSFVSCNNNNSQNNRSDRIQLHRKITVPTGKGLGGGSNINAGLVVPPAQEDFAFVPDDDENNMATACRVANKFDSVFSWPDTISMHIMDSIKEILSVMCKNKCIVRTNDLKNNKGYVGMVEPCENSFNENEQRYHEGMDNNSKPRKCNTPTIAKSETIFNTNNLWDVLKIPSVCKNIQFAAHNYENSDNNNSKKDSKQFPTTQIPKQNSKRRNYYEAILEPLLQQNANIFSKGILTIYNGYKAERVLLENDNDKTKETIDCDAVDSNIRCCCINKVVGGSDNNCNHFTNQCKTKKMQPKCIGIEVLHLMNGQLYFVHATRDVILCTGAIESPALLLASGIGNNDCDGGYDNRFSATRLQQTKNGTTSLSKTKNVTVGSSLRDHVVLGRILFVRDRKALENECMNMKYHNDDNIDNHTNHQSIATTTTNWFESSLNGVCSISTMKFDMVNSNYNYKNGSAGDNSSSSTTVCAQVLLFDSSTLVDMIPSIASAPFHLCFWQSGNQQHQSNVMIILTQFMNIILEFFYWTVRYSIYALVSYTPLYYWIQHYIVAEMIALMNPVSTGTITIIPKQQKQSNGERICSNNIATHGHKEHKRDVHCSKSSNGWNNGQYRRRSDFILDIDLGYLSNPNDIDRMMHIYENVTSVEANTATGGIELFPGPLIREFRIFKRHGQQQLHPRLHKKRFAFFARSYALPYFHWIGTCRMESNRNHVVRNTATNKNKSINYLDATEHCKSESCNRITIGTNHHVLACSKSNDDDDYVVDSKFRVRGISSGLRVCDASVLSRLPSAPIALTCAGLGHVLGTMLLSTKMKDNIIYKEKVA